MRVYIINADDLIVSREAPAHLSENEIVVASLDELRATRLNGKRLLALWNGLPGVDRLNKVGNREALVDRLWSALEALPDPQPPRASKQAEVIALLRRPEGVTVDEVRAATGWQPHTVRGVFSGALKKKLGLEASPCEGALAIHVSDGETFVPRLFAELGVPISSVRLSRPTLDDVFMTYTGRTIRDAEASASDRNRANPFMRATTRR